MDLATGRGCTSAPTARGGSRSPLRRFLAGLVASVVAAGLAVPSAQAQEVAAAPGVQLGPVAAALPAAVSDPTAVYVSAVYRDLFARSVDPSGLATWTAALNSGTPRVAVANSITYSAEYRSRLITGSYQQYLGRGPDGAGLAQWLVLMNRGLTIQEMERGFLASDEYYGRAGGNARGWVAALYRDVLGRAPSASETSAWTSILARGTSRSSVALGFLLSSEHLGTVINGQYTTLLQRGTDATGRSTWIKAIQAGTRTEAVIGSIVASNEYASRNAAQVSAAPTVDPVSAPVPVSTPATTATPAPTSSSTPTSTPVPASSEKPGTANTGAPTGRTLTVYTGDLTITSPGTVIDGLDIRGFVIIKAADVTIRNSIVRGSGPGSYNTGLINCNDAKVSRAVIEDVTLVPSYPSVWINGVIGHDFTARRVNTYHVVDGFNIYNVHGSTANVTVEASYVHDLSYFSPDPNHSDNKTHNDAIQIQGGSNISIVGNTLSAWLATTVGTQAYPYPQAGFGVILTPNVNAVTGSRINGNWFDGSYIPVKLSTSSKTGPMDFGQVNDNRFARDMRNVPMNGVNQWFTVLTTPDLTVQTVGNVYSDNGAAITVRRDSGTGTAP